MNFVNTYSFIWYKYVSNFLVYNAFWCMKKYFIIFLLFLFSCSSGEEWVVTWLVLHEGSGFDMSIPSNWETITQESNMLPKPKNSQIALAVSSQDLKYGFSNNLLILSQDLDKTISSTDFSIWNYVGSTKEYLEFVKLDSKNIDFINGEKSNIYVFEAKYNPQTPRFKYIQTGVVCEKKGYLITVALSTDIKDTSKYEEVIKTFQCK